MTNSVTYTNPDQRESSKWLNSHHWYYRQCARINTIYFNHPVLTNSEPGVDLNHNNSLTRSICIYYWAGNRHHQSHLRLEGDVFITYFDNVWCISIVYFVFHVCIFLDVPITRCGRLEGNTQPRSRMSFLIYNRSMIIIIPCVYCMCELQ